MAIVRSTRFLSSSAVPSGATGSSYTVPLDRTALIKCATFHNHSGVATSYRLEVRTSPTSVRTIAVGDLAIDEAVQLTGLFVVAFEGNTINVRRGSAGTISTTINGALLDGDPS